MTGQPPCPCTEMCWRIGEFVCLWNYNSKLLLQTVIRTAAIYPEPLRPSEPCMYIDTCSTQHCRPAVSTVGEEGEDASMHSRYIPRYSSFHSRSSYCDRVGMHYIQSTYCMPLEFPDPHHPGRLQCDDRPGIPGSGQSHTKCTYDPQALGLHLLHGCFSAMVVFFSVCLVILTI